MIDMVTYRELHPEEDALETREYISDEQMESDEPPAGDTLLVLPVTVHGFGFQDKKWRK